MKSTGRNRRIVRRHPKAFRPSCGRDDSGVQHIATTRDTGQDGIKVLRVCTHRNERSAPPNPGNKAKIHPHGLDLEQANLDMDVGLPELLDPHAIHPRVRINHRHSDILHPRGDQCLAARRSAPPVTARLEGDVRGGSPRPLSGQSKRHGFAVRPPPHARRSFPDNLISVGKDTSHGGIGPDRTEARSSKIERAPHERAVIQSVQM